VSTVAVVERPQRPDRLRIRFAKHGKVRFVSHRDTARIWERALRRARVAVAYSAGFVPRPKIAFGLALSTGYSSDAEYLDVELDPAATALTVEGGLAQLTGRLSDALPVGMTALAAGWVSADEPSLQHSVTSCSWLIEITGSDFGAVASAVAAARAADEILVERERKAKMVTEDIRPALLSLECSPGDPSDGDVATGTAELSTQPRALRPAELLAGLEVQLEPLRVCRLKQWITANSGELREPLALTETSKNEAVLVR